MLDVEQADHGRRFLTRGSITVSGKWIASSSPAELSAEPPGATVVRVIATIRPRTSARRIGATVCPAIVLDDRGLENPIVVLADPSEGSNELSRIELRAPDNPGNERQRD